MRFLYVLTVHSYFENGMVGSVTITT